MPQLCQPIMSSLARGMLEVSAMARVTTVASDER
jgi:hypothetical protein